MANRKLKSVVTVVRNGVIAGIVGTAAMDLLWYRRYRRDGGQDGLFDWEFATGTEGYEDAGAPAQVGKRVVEGVLKTELEPGTARTMTNVVHWATGIGWGTLHAVLLASAKRQPQAAYGFATGASAWATSYAMLAPMKLYKPIWEYPAAVLGKDLSAHLVYGLGVGAASSVLARSSRVAEPA